MQSPQVSIMLPNFLFLRKLKSLKYGFLKETNLNQNTSRASVKTLRKVNQYRASCIEKNFSQLAKVVAEAKLGFLLTELINV